MEHRTIGELEVSTVGLGCNNFGMMIDADGTQAVVDAALDAGITYFDTAESYGHGHSEEMLGRALGSRRDEAVIATKWGHPKYMDDGVRGGEPAEVRRAPRGQPHPAGHRPRRPLPAAPPGPGDPAGGDARVPGRAAGRGQDPRDRLHRVQRRGARRPSAAAEAAGVAPWASVQNHYSLLTRDPETDGVFDACARLGIAFVPFFPLESGLLTGKYRQGQDRPDERPAGPLGRSVRRLHRRRPPRRGGAAHRLVRRARPHPAGAGHQLAHLPPPGRLGHLRGHQPDQVGPTWPPRAGRLTAEDRAEVDRIVAGGAEEQPG